MARVISRSFRDWLLEQINTTADIMIRARQRSYEVQELYELLIPNVTTRNIMMAAGEYLKQEESQGFHQDIITHFPNGYKASISYYIAFRNINTTSFNHILLPYDLEPLTIDSELGRNVIPLASVAVEWASLYYVVDEILTHIATDNRAISNLFPWCKSLIAGSQWAKERTRFRSQIGLNTKKAQEECDATFEAALGEPFNVPPLTNLITERALSGNKLFSQARMLMNTPEWRDKYFTNKTTITPYISNTNVPEVIRKHIQDITKFVQERKTKKG